MQSIFGTDGIRGIFNKEITYDLAQKIGFVFGTINNETQKILFHYIQADYDWLIS